MAAVLRERTIAFFEIARLQGVEAKRVDQFDWQSFLHVASSTSVEDRTWEDDQTYLGTVLDWQGSFQEIEVDKHTSCCTASRTPASGCRASTGRPGRSKTWSRVRCRASWRPAP